MATSHAPPLSKWAPTGLPAVQIHVVHTSTLQDSEFYSRAIDVVDLLLAPSIRPGQPDPVRQVAGHSVAPPALAGTLGAAARGPLTWLVATIPLGRFIMLPVL